MTKLQCHARRGAERDRRRCQRRSGGIGRRYSGSRSPNPHNSTTTRAQASRGATTAPSARAAARAAAQVAGRMAGGHRPGLRDRVPGGDPGRLDPRPCFRRVTGAWRAARQRSAPRHRRAGRRPRPAGPRRCASRSRATASSVELPARRLQLADKVSQPDQAEECHAVVHEGDGHHSQGCRPGRRPRQAVDDWPGARSRPRAEAGQRPRHPARQGQQHQAGQQAGQRPLPSSRRTRRTARP